MMRHRPLLAVMLGALAFVSRPAMPAPADRPHPVVTGEYRDALVEDIPIGGRTLVVGVATRRSHLALTKTIRITVPVRPDMAGAICLDVVSRDGRYTGRGDYRVIANGAHRLDIDVASNHLDQVTATDSRNLAFLVRKGRCTEADAAKGVTQVLPVTLAAADPSAPLDILLNAGPGSVRMFTRPADTAGTGTPLTCAGLRDRQIRFNLHCPHPAVAPFTPIRLDIAIYDDEAKQQLLRATIELDGG
ncbi:hypothetical protein P7L75_04330 (plasmid) [Tistrella mobilis]|uniref:hypothetical protein n=1 Tax=Tistrella mobilis TaxID=171437 RepID=UPI00355609BF